MIIIVKYYNDSNMKIIVKYVNNKTKVTIKCKHHGMFEQQPNNHISGQGCPKCKNDKLSNNMTKSSNTLLGELNDIFLKENYLFDLKNYDYKITCNLEGEVIATSAPTWRLYEYNYNMKLFEERYNILSFVGGYCGLLYAK